MEPLNEKRTLTNVSRQAFRSKVINLAFQDISAQYTLMPRKARRKMSRVIGKQAFKAWRNGDVQPKDA